MNILLDIESRLITHPSASLPEVSLIMITAKWSDVKIFSTYFQPPQLSPPILTTPLYVQFG